MPKKLQDFIQKFAQDLQRYGEDKMLNEMIPWHRATTASDPLSKKTYPVSAETNTAGETALYLLKDGAKTAISKRDLAYAFDVFDAKGEMINVMWIAL